MSAELGKASRDQAVGPPPCATIARTQAPPNGQKHGANPCTHLGHIGSQSEFARVTDRWQNAGKADE
jgi:hypothetical protein